jgi:hypothetical protein
MESFDDWRRKTHNPGVKEKREGWMVLRRAGAMLPLPVAATQGMQRRVTENYRS